MSNFCDKQTDYTILWLGCELVKKIWWNLKNVKWIYRLQEPWFEEKEKEEKGEQMVQKADK